MDHNKLWKILKEMGILDHLTCLLRNLHAGQEARIRTRHGRMDWFQIENGAHQTVCGHPAYLTYMQSQFSSVTQLCPTLCDRMDCSTPGLPIHQQLLEFTLTHIHQVSDAIRPSYPLSSLSPPTFNLSQHQDLFQ